MTRTLSSKLPFRLSIVALSATVAITGAVDEAEADAGDFIAGAIVGAVANHAANKNKQRRASTVRRSSSSRRRAATPRRSTIPSTQEGRQIQSSLNYFGFNAGSVDGQLGRKSRNAISQYQAYLGYPVTGQLSPFEQNLLLTSWNRAQAGGYATTQLIAQNPEGVRGLLKTYRAEMAGTLAVAPGVTPIPAPTTTVVVNPTVLPTTVAPTQVATPTPEAESAPVEAATPAVPNFLGTATVASLASHCNKVSLITNTNGGFTTAANLTDANFALNEQFCLARTFAITKGEELASGIKGFTPQQIEAQCDAFGPTLKPFVAALSLKPASEVISDVSSFVLEAGMSPAQMSGTAQICLSVGYRTDNMDVAIGSALLLTALGEPVYGEFLGHHLAQGFGATERVDLAAQWYDMGLNALDSGATPAVLPGMPERGALIRKASVMLNGNAAAGQPTGQAQVLPVFNLE
ncbi:peptidoglycan-binding domain-containing protein [Actibacterium sp. 188UL27-1]|uniref:peptidoglycan-binding domain-containing protein n=1 Tax=Actibacterium sp. 188UL27-1 TaxID=2786961 RepID=UPI00195A229B|nr:peptidoglycan-binding domain-containing protein [Actibacterium sp. 188UL27-1]MBM7068863.1 peptidoglycan-binding protein [Actibacterium sp. 188UL27-1]